MLLMLRMLRMLRMLLMLSVLLLMLLLVLWVLWMLRVLRLLCILWMLCVLQILRVLRLLRLRLRALWVCLRLCRVGNLVRRCRVLEGRRSSIIRKGHHPFRALGAMRVRRVGGIAVLLLLSVLRRLPLLVLLLCLLLMLTSLHRLSVLRQRRRGLSVCSSRCHCSWPQVRWKISKVAHGDVTVQVVRTELQPNVVSHEPVANQRIMSECKRTAHC